MFIVAQRTGFCTFFLYTWDGVEDRWLTRKDLAKRFTAAEARKIADVINARNPGAPLPAEVRPA